MPPTRSPFSHLPPPPASSHAYAHLPPPPPRETPARSGGGGGWWKWLLATGTIVFIGLVFAAANAGRSPTEIGERATKPTTDAPVSSRVPSTLPQSDPVDDVAAVRVSPPDILGAVYIEVTVTNRSSKRSDYWIDLTLTSSNGSIKYGDTWVSISDLEPGQTMTEKAFPIFAEEATGGLRYEYRVRRTASWG